MFFYLITSNDVVVLIAQIDLIENGDVDKYGAYQPILGNDFCEREWKGGELALCKAQNKYMVGYHYYVTGCVLKPTTTDHLKSIEMLRFVWDSLALLSVI